MALVANQPVVMPNLNHSISCPPVTPSWLQHLRANARKALRDGDVSEKQMALAKAKAQQKIRCNRKNSMRHAKGIGAKTARPGKGKQGSFVSSSMLAYDGEDDAMCLEGLEEQMYQRYHRYVHGGLGVVDLLRNRVAVAEFKVGQRVEVVSHGLATVTCQGGYKCCVGYKRCNKGIGVTYDDGTKYHCDHQQLRHHEPDDLPCRSEQNFGCPLVQLSSAKFTLVATSLDGTENPIPNVSADMTVRDLKQSIARTVGIPSRTVQIVSGEQVLLDEKKTLGSLDITGPGAHVSLFERTMDPNAWNLLLKDLLVAISSGEVVEARYLLGAFVECKGEFRLAHALSYAYFGGSADISWFLLENAPAEVLFQALVMNGARSYRFHVSKPLLWFMYIHEDFDSLSLIGQRLGSKWLGCLRSQCQIPQDEWAGINYYIGNPERSLIACRSESVGQGSRKLLEWFDACERV